MWHMLAGHWTMKLGRQNVCVCVCVFQMSAISPEFGLELWNLAVSLMSTCSFSLCFFIIFFYENKFILISGGHIWNRSVIRPCNKSTSFYSQSQSSAWSGGHFAWRWARGFHASWRIWLLNWQESCLWLCDKSEWRTSHQCVLEVRKLQHRVNGRAVRSRDSSEGSLWPEEPPCERRLRFMSNRIELICRTSFVLFIAQATALYRKKRDRNRYVRHAN